MTVHDIEAGGVRGVARDLGKLTDLEILYFNSKHAFRYEAYDVLLFFFLSPQLMYI